MSALDCSMPGCEDPGVIPYDHPDGTQGWHCFVHAGIVAGEAPEVAQEAPPEFIPDVVNNFAAEILEAASVSHSGDGATVQGVFDMLAEETMLDRNICAAILLACSMLITAGQVPAEDVLSLSNTLRENAADAEWQDQPPPPLASETTPVVAGLGSGEFPEAGTDADHVCPDCDGIGKEYADNETASGPGCQTCNGTGYLPEATGDDLPIDNDEGALSE